MSRAALAAAVGSALLLAGCSTATGGAGGTTPASSSPPSTAEQAPERLVVGGEVPVGSRVSVVGDSIVRGYGLEPGAAWPALVGDALGWTVTNLGCDGGGFVRPGVCGEPIGDRADDIAETEPDVVIVVASSNDLGTASAEVAAAIPPAVAAIVEAVPSARLIALDSVWGPDPRPADLDAYDRALIDAVVAAGGDALEYPDPLRADGLLAADGLHPTEAGQQALAEAFTLAAEKAGLAQAVQRDLRATDAPE